MAPAAPSDADATLAIPQDEPSSVLAAARSAKDAAEKSGDQKAKAIACIKVADALSLTGAASEAMAQATEAVELCEEVRFDIGRGAALAVLARICATHGAGEDDAELGFDSAQDALRLFRKMGLQRGEAVALWSTSLVEVAFGTPQRAVQCAKEAMLKFRELGDGVGEAIACLALADGYLRAGQPQRAVQAVDRSTAIQASLGNRRKEAACLHSRASIELERGDQSGAIATLGRARATLKDLRDHHGEAAVLGTAQQAHLAAGSVTEALRAAQEKVTVYHQAGDRKAEGRALLGVASLLLQAGDTARAGKVSEIALGILSETQDRDAVVEAMEMLGAVKHAQVKSQMHSAIEASADFMHVPKHLIIDPGLSLRLQDSYKEAARKGLI